MATQTYKAIATSALAILGAAFALHACASGRVEIHSPGGTGGSGAGGGIILGGGGGGTAGRGIVSLDATIAQPDTRKADAPIEAKPFRCDKNGKCNICLAILSLGQAAHYGSNGGGDNTDAFQKFMNDNTGGTATMAMLTTYTPLTDELLNQYDIVILQELQTDRNGKPWEYSQSDIDALKKWVTETGGAVISLSGYFSDMPNETVPLNQLMAPYGISYNTDDLFNQSACPDTLCYCSWGSIPFDNWQQTDADCAAITVNHDGSKLGKVGVFRGRSIKCSGSDCSVFAKDAAGAIVGVAKKVGNGRILAWADEWITYTSQWGLVPDPQWDVVSPGTLQCQGHTARTSFVIPQFWYNAFKWVAPTAACFTIEQPTAPELQIIY